jgi:hypothetical protein
MFTIVFISAKLLDSITLRVLRSSPLGPHASAHTQRSRRERCTRVTPRHPVERGSQGRLLAVLALGTLVQRVPRGRQPLHGLSQNNRILASPRCNSARLWAICSRHTRGCWLAAGADHHARSHRYGATAASTAASLFAHAASLLRERGAQPGHRLLCTGTGSSGGEANCPNSENSASAEFQPVASHEIVQPQQELRT